jgi:hypothetical protein
MIMSFILLESQKDMNSEAEWDFFSRIFWNNIIKKCASPNGGAIGKCVFCFCFSCSRVVEEVRSIYSSFSSLERSGLTNEAKKDLGGSSLKDTRRRFIMGCCCCWEAPANAAAQGLVSGLTSRSNWTCCSSVRSTGEVHLALFSSRVSSGSVVVSVSMESKLRLEESVNKRQSLEDFPNEFNLVLC